MTQNSDTSATPPLMTEEEVKRFEIASEHPYECRCQLCKEWWEQVPPEE